MVKCLMLNIANCMAKLVEVDFGIQAISESNTNC